MSDTTRRFRTLSLRFQQSLALIFVFLGVLLVTLITLHWFLVLEPTLRTEANSRSAALAQAQAQNLERLLGSGLTTDRLKTELQTTLDGILLLKDQATGSPFIRQINLTVDYDLFDVPRGSLDFSLGSNHCEDCFIVRIPLYHPRDRLLIGIVTCYSSPQFLEQLVHDVRLKLLWVGGIILCLIGLAWFETRRLLHRLTESESNLRNVFEAAPFPMILSEYGQLGLKQANRAAKIYLDLRRDTDGSLTSEPWLTLYAAGLPTEPGQPRETLVPTADGTPRWALVSARPVRFSGAPSHLISLVDVSELKAIQEELRSASFTDGLTGLYNRRYLFLKLTKEIDLVRRYGHPLSIFLFDLDHFKGINDRFGHQMGDTVLIEVARALRRSVREVDVAGRYGGEEFLVILPHAAATDALEVAQRILTNVRALTWPQSGLRVTLSGGLCEYDGTGVDAFIEMADQRLYQAKQTGRDQVIFS